MDFDWEKIKTEYITDANSSYRKIAEKYGVSFSTLKYRAKTEGWAELKEQFRHDLTTKTIDNEMEKQVDRRTRLMDVTDKLLEKIEETVGGLTSNAIVCDRYIVKQISGALKDIKEIQGIKSDMDIREQEAKIKNLEKQAEADDIGTEVTIKFEGDTAKWAK